MENDQIVEIYKRLAQLDDQMSYLMRSVMEMHAATNSRVDPLEAGIAELMKSNLTALNLSNTQTERSVTLLAHMENLRGEISLIKETLTAISSTRH